MLEYWEFHPPVNETVALFVGIKPPEEKIAPDKPMEEFKIIAE